MRLFYAKKFALGLLNYFLNKFQLKFAIWCIVSMKRQAGLTTVSSHY